MVRTHAHPLPGRPKAGDGLADGVEQADSVSSKSPEKSPRYAGLAHR